MTCNMQAADSQSKVASIADEERKVALSHLRAIRSTGQKNLIFGCRVRDSCALIDTPAMGCGIAALIEEVLRDPKKRAKILAQGEAIYATIRGTRRRASGEVLLHLDPAWADQVTMALTGSGLKVGPRQAGWSVFRGAVEAEAVRALLEGFGIAAHAYHLHEIDGFVPLSAEAPSTGTEPAPTEMDTGAGVADRPSAAAETDPVTNGNETEADLVVSTTGRDQDAAPSCLSNAPVPSTAELSEAGVEPATPHAVDTPHQLKGENAVTVGQPVSSRLFGLSEEVLNSLLYPASDKGALAEKTRAAPTLEEEDEAP